MNTTTPLNYTALNIAKAERELSTSLFAELAILQAYAEENRADKLQVGTFIFFFRAGGIEVDQLDDRISQAFSTPVTLTEAVGEIILGLSDSGFLAKNLAESQKIEARELIKKAVEQAREMIENTTTSPSSETSQNGGEATKA